ILQIDDHIVIAIVPSASLPRSPSLSTRDRQIMSRAAAAYKKVNLRENISKKITEESLATVLGGTLDGQSGLISAPPLKVLVLCHLTLRLIHCRACTRALLSTILGCWVYVIMFRRPFLCLLSAVFHEGDGLDRSEIFQLSAAARSELLYLILLAPVIVTDLRAEPLERLFATDASPWAAGIVSTGLGSAAILELSRVADHRGFYTRIDSAVGSYLSEVGARSSETQALLNEMLSIPRPLSEGVLWDVCEVFKGEGHFSKMHEERGLRVHPGFEILIDPELGDIMLDSTAWAIMGLILRRVVLVWLFAPPCITFGTLRRPRLRSKEQPGGFDPNCPITRRGNRFAFRTAIFMNLIGFCNQYAYAEQPRGSVMYKLWTFLQLLQHPASRFDIYNFPFCGHGSPFEKFSSWMSNVPGMEVMRDVCRCPFKGKHLRVESSFTQEALDLFCQRCDPSPLEVYGRAPARGESLARFSGSYPLAAMRKIAAISEAALAGLTVDDDRRPAFVPPKWIVELAAGLDYRVDFAQAFDSVRGADVFPKNTSARASFDLTPVARLAPKTAGSRLALFSAFERWCAAELDAPVAVLARSGLVLSTALIAYGRHLFYSEKPLYIFTETLNGIVDRYRHLKVYFAECWSLISRWEDAEPTERKMVLPEPVIRAIVALSLSWGWPRFAAAILLGFHGLLVSRSCCR
ncbi:unnamed protein product, partial [Polarella glacialis]